MIDLSESQGRERWHVEKTWQETHPLRPAAPLGFLIAIKGSQSTELLSAARLATISGNEWTLGALWLILDNLA